MSLRPNGLTEIPAETARVARAAFPKGCLAMRMRDALGSLLLMSSSPSCSRHEGVQPGRLRGWRWCWCWEFVEGLTDRQAADQVRGRLDWKYALGLDLSDPGFDASVLTQCSACGCAPMARPSGCWGCCSAGCARAACWLLAGASAPTPPTSTWRCATCTGWSRSPGTLRAALEALAVVAPAWLGAVIPPEWTRRYGGARR
jgi:Transposase domain (DUF772)